MALKDIFQGFGGSAKELAEVLARLDSGKVPVRVEIENTQTRFESRLMIKKESVVILKPAGLKDELEAGSHIRFKVPDNPAQEVRLEVTTPHLNLASGHAVFLCKMPTAALRPAKRRTERYNVTRFKNVLLVLAKRGRHFRVVDVSLNGCKVSTTPAEAHAYFPLGEELDFVQITLGTKTKVDLERVIPRAHLGQTVGCEFEVSAEGASKGYLDQLIETLEKAETRNLRGTEPAQAPRPPGEA
jgi:hypothetical protein